jgi:hypothetical protein
MSEEAILSRAPLAKALLNEIERLEARVEALEGDGKNVDLRENNADGYTGLSLKEFLDRQKQQRILTTLRECKGDKLKAAEILEISLSTLYRELNAFQTSRHELGMWNDPSAGLDRIEDVNGDAFSSVEGQADYRSKGAASKRLSAVVFDIVNHASTEGVSVALEDPNFSGSSSEAERSAEAFLVHLLRALNLSERKFSSLPKRDSRKTAIAVALRVKTVVSYAWLARRLEMGTRSNVCYHVQRILRRHRSGEGPSGSFECVMEEAELFERALDEASQA